MKIEISIDQEMQEMLNALDISKSKIEARIYKTIINTIVEERNNPIRKAIEKIEKYYNSTKEEE